MISKFSRLGPRAFSLLEVLITVAILSTAIVLVLRGFTAVLSSAKFSQNITLACFFAEDKLGRIEKGLLLTDAFPENTEFTYNHELSDPSIPNLKQLRLTVSWKEKKDNLYSLEFLTYILSDNR